ncbi:unnamed protein product, partial [Mesorhabditis belari]|uniref:TBC1 domain family member 15 n=1 Tax=Mesorhabditis belari TaxID=2138241 RepID=A0AAF3J7T9_9BILA
MIPILAYQYVKKRNEANRRKMAEEPTSNSAGRSVMPDVVVLRLSAVGAKNNEDETYVSGVLQVVEKARGVFIEWTPAEDSPVSGWVLADGNDENALLSTSPPQRSFRENVNKLKFSMDVNDLNSFKHVEPKKGDPMIRLIGRDGSSQVPLYFRQTSTSAFIDCLQKYITLRRSSKDPNLVLVVDEKADILAKSVVALDNNSDILSRFMGNPYATAMTGLGKITAYMQEQVIPALLDSDEVGAEDKIRAMRELRNDDEFGDRIRVYRGEDQGDFEVVTQLELPPRPEIYRETPVTKQIWDSYKNPHGSFDQRNLHNLKMCVFRGGVEPELRKEAWKYLLGYIRWNESLAEHKLRRQELEKDYYRMKGQWMSINAEQESRFLMFSNRKSLVEKDVARTDRTYKYFEGEGNANLTRLHDVLMTYCMYNFDLGYVQGMSDFCSPILFVLEDEVDAFWCFTKLMDIVHSNFAEDQLSIKQQLNQLHDLVMIVNPKLCNYLESHQSDDMYFCFRWILVWFKREFSFEDTSKLWEVLWTKQPCTNFLLLICVAILDKETEFIIANGFGLTEILKHVNELSMHINLDEVLSAAEAIFHQLSASQDKLPKYVLDHLRLSEPDPY